MSKVGELIEFLKGDEFLQCALTEAVSRFYYHESFNNYTDRPAVDSVRVSQLHQTMICAIPDWRYRIKRHMDRYFGEEATAALNLDGRPGEITTLQVDFSVIVKNQSPE